MATLLSTAPNCRGAGIHQYSANLLSQLPLQAPQYDYRAFVMDQNYDPPPHVALHRPTWLPPSPSGRILWEQTRVAWECRGLNLLHGLAYALPVAARVPSVVTVHDLTFILFADAFPKSKQRYLSRITAHSCRRASMVIADSQATAHDLQQLLDVPADKIQVIYTGVDERYQPLPLEKQVAILYAGTRGFLDQYPIEVLAKYEAGLYQFIEDRYSQVFTEIDEKQEIDDDLDKLMTEALTAYDEEFKDTIK